MDTKAKHYLRSLSGDSLLSEQLLEQLLKIICRRCTKLHPNWAELYMRYSWETCLSRRSLPHPPPWWRIPHHPPLGNSPRQRWGWRILMHDEWNILCWRTFVYINNLLMTDIMMRSSYFDLEEERSSGWSDSSSIWGRACSSKETDLKLEERKVVSRGLSSTISSSRLSMSYTLVDPPRWPFHIFAIIFWKDHKFINYWKDRWS